MKKIVLAEASLSGVTHQAKGGSMKAQLKLQAVLSPAEQKKLHIGLNGFKAVELDQEYECVQLKLIPPEGLELHQLAILLDRAAKFKVREHNATEEKPSRQMLEFTAYASGPQYEAVNFMTLLGTQVCRLELVDIQQELFDGKDKAADTEAD